MTARIVRVLRNAFFSKGFELFGFPFARDYLRLAWRASRRWGYQGPGRLKILGFRVEYPNQSHAVFLFHEIFVNGTYWFTSSRPEPHIVDCGSNIGMALLFFKALYPRAAITAFEPENATFQRLRGNVERNMLSEVTLINAAVGEKTGRLVLYSGGDEGSLTTSVDPSWGGREAREVRSVALSSLLEKPVDFLKLDVEGVEYGVVRDLIGSGKVGRIKEAVIEHHPVGSEPDGLAQMVGSLQAAGMTAEPIAGSSAATSNLIRVRRSAGSNKMP
jgi:FkbM family methyltransferase